MQTAQLHLWTFWYWEVFIPPKTPLATGLVISRSFVNRHTFFGYRYLGDGGTDRREILHDGTYMSRMSLLPFWGRCPQGSPKFAYPHGGYCFANALVRSFVCRQCVLVGQWSDGPSTTLVLAAVSGRSAAGPAGRQVSQMFPPLEKLYPREIYARGGGLLMGSINAPRLFNQLFHAGTV